MQTENHIIAVEARCDALEIRLAAMSRELDGANHAIQLMLNVIACDMPIIRPDGRTVRLATLPECEP